MKHPKKEKAAQGLVAAQPSKNPAKGSLVYISSNQGGFNPKPQTMTSLEIAEFLGKQHKHVVRSIKRLMDKGVIAHSPMGNMQKDGGNSRTYEFSVYVLEKRDTYVVVAQLSPEFTGKLVDRWQELEEAIRVNSPEEQRRLMIREDGKVPRKGMTGLFKARGVDNPKHYAQATDVTYVKLTGQTAKEIKKDRGLKPYQSARDAMNSLELSQVALTEEIAIANINDFRCWGADECIGAVKQAAEAVSKAVTDGRSRPSGLIGGAE